MQINSDDVKMLKAFRTVINKGDFNVKGSAISMVGSLFRWVEDFEKRMEDSLVPDKIKPKIKKEVIKKI